MTPPDTAPSRDVDREPKLSDIDGPWTVHDPGCRCWPHVSAGPAQEAVIEAARREYVEGRALRAQPVPDAAVGEESDDVVRAALGDVLADYFPGNHDYDDAADFVLRNTRGLALAASHPVREGEGLDVEREAELRSVIAEVEAADEPAYRHIMSGSFVKERILAGTILPEWLRLRLLALRAQPVKEGLDVAVLRAAYNVIDRRTLLDDGYWVSQKEMHALDVALSGAPSRKDVFALAAPSRPPEPGADHD